MINNYKTRLGDVAVDYNAMRVWFNGDEVRLTNTEFKILCELAINAGKVIGYDTLLEKIWGKDYLGEKPYIHEYIRRLRIKLEPHNRLHSCIKNIPGIGYRFDCTQ